MTSLQTAVSAVAGVTWRGTSPPSAPAIGDAWNDGKLRVVLSIPDLEQVPGRLMSLDAAAVTAALVAVPSYSEATYVADWQRFAGRRALVGVWTPAVASPPPGSALVVATATTAQIAAMSTVLAAGEVLQNSDTRDFLVGDGSTAASALLKNGSGSYGQLWATPDASTALTGTLVAWTVTAVDCTAGAGARTLPLANSVPAKTEFAAKKGDTGNNNLVVSASGSDKIFGTATGSTTKTLTLPGEAVTFVSDGVSKYTVRESDTPSGALSATYVPWSKRPQRRFVALGDSIVLGGYTSTAATGGTWQQGPSSWATWAAALSKQNLVLVQNSGIGGNNSTQMLARIQTDVIAYAPEVCGIGGFTNDYTASLTVAQSVTNLAAMVAACRAAGVDAFVLTLCPRNNDAPGLADSRVRSLAIQDWCMRNGVRVVDGYAPLADTATGAYATGVYVNDLHPNQKGARILGQAVVDTLFGTTPPKPGVWTPASNLDGTNRLANGLMITDVNADGIPDSWSAGGSATSATRDITTDAGVVGGKLARLNVVTAASSYRTNQQPAIASIGSTGDAIAVVGRIKTSGIESGSGNWYVQTNFQDAGGVAQSPTYYPLGAGITVDLADGYFYLEIGTVPAAATKLDVRVVVASGAGVVGFTEMGVLNLTAAGAIGLQPN